MRQHLAADDQIGRLPERIRARRQPSRVPGGRGDAGFPQGRARYVQFAWYSSYIIHRLLTTPCCLDYGPAVAYRPSVNVNDFRNAVDTAILYPCLLSA